MTTSHLLLVSCIVSAFEDLFDRLPNKAYRERWLQKKITLRPIQWDDALKLVGGEARQRRRISHYKDVESIRKTRYGR